MEIFGPQWEGYTDKIASHWRRQIRDDDLVLVPGDISWAMRLEEAMPDLEWLHQLPGTKLLLRGNHDYWWGSASKMRKTLPPTLHFIQNDAYYWNGVAIAGSRLWDTPEYNFSAFTEIIDNPRSNTKALTERADGEQSNKIFQRELERLKLSLSKMDRRARHKIAMTHYPPIGADLAQSAAAALLEEFGVEICVFGHLHNLKKQALPLFGRARGVQYILTSCDLIDFTPIRIL